MRDEMCAALRVWLGCLAAAVAVIAVVASAGVAHAQTGARGTWTFSTDSANNLVIQDLEAFTTATGRVGAPVCLQYHPSCPSSSDRRANDLRLAKPRYALRGSGGKEPEWRVEVGQPTVRDAGTTLPFQVSVMEQGMVQVVSSPGPWAVNLQRIPAAELRVADGKRWNVFLTLSEAPPDPEAAACWIEVACPAG
ncbi:MAG TPA: hypothetical protein VN493_31830 [Thermoanaerobaculia bacterium]|nr:hypothetical protein [Thermoanaerobaculia bacterium]